MMIYSIRLSSNDLKIQNDTKPTHETVFHEANKSILFLFAVLGIGCLVKNLLKKIDLPYTVALFTLASVFGYIGTTSEDIEEYEDIANFPANVLMQMFLPILIFESAYSMDAHYFLRSIKQCLLLAIPGLLISAALTAVYAKYILYPYHWDWNACFLFGCILSATDPVAVVALLREVGMSPALTTIIEGESLLNDGSAIVLFQVIFRSLESTDKDFSALSFLLMFLRIAIGALFFGYSVGITTSWAVLQIHNDAVLEFSTTLCSAYLSYYVAEDVLGISGVLTVVTVGVVVSSHKSSFSPESEETVHSFWELMAYFANTLIFTIVGIIIAEKSIERMVYTDGLLALATYVAVTVFRFSMILILSPLLRRMGYGLPWKHVAVLVWGGLRGAVGLALAMMLNEKSAISLRISDEILIQLSMIIVMTLVVNGITMKYILKLLGLDKIPQSRLIAMAHATEHLRSIADKSINFRRRDQLLCDANWSWVERHTYIRDPYNAIDEFDIRCQYSSRESSNCPSCRKTERDIPSEGELKEMSEETRCHVLKALKVCYWKYFKRGLICRDTVNILTTVTDEAIDQPEKYIDVKLLEQKYMTISRLLQNVKNGLSLFGDKLGIDSFRKVNEGLIVLHNESTGLRHFCLELLTSTFWEPIIFLIIVTNVIPIILEVTKFDLLKLWGHDCAIYMILAFIYLLLFIMEAAIKIIAIGWKTYIENSYNKFAFFLLIFGTIDVVIDFINFFVKFTDVYYIATLRLVRLVRLIELHRMFWRFLAKSVAWLKNEACADLYLSYDIGRCFIKAQNEVMEKINYLVDYKPCADIPLRESEEAVLELMKTLSDMQVKNRGIVIARKTHVAANCVLNDMKLALKELHYNGLLDVVEFDRLKMNLADMRLKIQKAPKFLSDATSVRKILKKVDWLADKRLFHAVLRNYVVKEYKAHHKIHEAGNKASGISIIASGVVKITGTVSPEKYEHIPNSDSFQYFVSQGNFFEYVTTGFSLGLIGSVQNSNFVTTALCETDVQVLHINPITFLKADLRMSERPPMPYLIWRSISVKIAPLILSEQPIYRNISLDQINLKVETSLIPDLLAAEKFTTNELIEAIVLIQGRVRDPVMGDLYVGPCYIPNTTKLLLFQDQPDLRPRVVMLILAKDSYYLPPQLDWSGFDSTTSRGKLCLFHTIQHRLSSVAEYELKQFTKSRGSEDTSYGCAPFWKRHRKETSRLPIVDETARS